MEVYFIHLGILIGIYLILALSLQLALGYTGLINLGHIGFFAIGAYTSALLTLNGFSFLFAFLASGFIAMLSAIILLIPTNKLKGDYLALATLSFTFVVYALALNWNSLTHGPIGLPGIPKPYLFGIHFSSNLSFLILTVIITLASYLIIKRIIDSPFGRVLEATRDNELSTRILGKNTYLIKLYAFGLSAVFAGFSGSLYAHYITYIDPSSFTLMQLIPILTIVIIGGIASLRGTIMATIILILLPETFRFIGFSSSIVGPMRDIIYALLLIIVLLYKPKGFYGNVELE